jgi:Rod binding domain-containing protein
MSAPISPITSLIAQNAGSQAVSPDPAQFLSLLGKNRPRSEAEIDKISQDFESVFMTQMLQPMFNGQDTQWFGGGESEDPFRSIMVSQFGTLIAKSGGVGIADMVKKELLSLQEVQPAPAQAPAVKG